MPRSSVITNQLSGATFDANPISPPYHEDKNINRYKTVDLSKLNTGAENTVKKRNQNNINNTNYTNKKILRRVHKTITAIKTKNKQQQISRKLQKGMTTSSTNHYSEKGANIIYRNSQKYRAENKT